MIELRCVRLQTLRDVSPKSRSARTVAAHTFLENHTCAPRADAAEKNAIFERVMSSLPATIAHRIIKAGGSGPWDRTSFVSSSEDRTTRDSKPAEAAVARDKQRELRMVARDSASHATLMPVAIRRARHILRAGGGRHSNVSDTFSVSVSYNR
jgi:hypothetical protein